MRFVSSGVRNEGIRRLTWLAWLACGLATACETEDAGPLAVFPPDVTTGWAKLRDCRHSHEHELRFIEVFVNELAEKPYTYLRPDVTYPEGSVLVKAEYDDPGCTKRLGFTAMRKEARGYAPEHGDWRWQELDTKRRVEQEGVLPVCVRCHTEHCAPPYGYDLTCSEEI